MERIHAPTCLVDRMYVAQNFEHQHFTLELLGRHFDGFTFWQVVSQWVGWDLVVLKKVNGCSSEKTGRGRGWPSWSQSSRLTCGRAREGGGWVQGGSQANIFPPKYTRCRWWWAAGQLEAIFNGGGEKIAMLSSSSWLPSTLSQSWWELFYGNNFGLRTNAWFGEIGR